MASLAILLLLARISSSIAISSNYISRSAEQQVIATVAPAIVPDIDGQSAQPFLTSPSGSYAAYLRRVVDSGGGLVGDACYVQVQQAGASGSVWESDCTPVGGADACDLAFSPVGLELFAGGHSLWDTGVDADPGTLSLDDGGDMKIVSREGVMVWTASGEPWTGQQCGAPLPVSTIAPSVEALPPPSTAGTKLVTPPAATLAGAGSTDLSFGDQPEPQPVDTLPDLPVQQPVDTAPELPPSASPDLPDLSLPPPPAYTTPDSPDQPLPAPPPADMLPDQPLYSSPPPAPPTFGPQTPLPPFGVPLAAPPTGDTIPGTTATPSGEPGSPGSVPFSGPSPVGMPHPHGHPHQLPLGASPPLPDALAPGGVHGAGAGQPGAPFGHGQQQAAQGVFGQQPQLLNGEGQPLEDSAGGWSRSESGRAAACMALFALVTLGFGF
ncbi:unnamed protein product [Miscanthus lutarioriparius]|uniref:Uncharacterized protein n=1 Tax=Miscanthus lutarioriparius TaxID=422564 RepID=A0A811MZA8_9POAL|nr:unnamed protein product [Miscanthus lutarioriparius]